MCGRFSLRADPGRLFEEFGLEPPADRYVPRYNIAPTQDVLVLRLEGDGAVLRYVRWGLVPYWSRDGGGGARLINARAETLGTRSAFREPYRRRRCVVLADGFYEWPRIDGRKQPVRVRLRSDRPFAMAAIWDRWRGPDGRLETCAIVTTDAAPALRGVHDRMPVLLEREDVGQWLGARARARELSALLRPYPGEDLEYYAVPSVVSSPANDVPECCEPL